MIKRALLQTLVTHCNLNKNSFPSFAIAIAVKCRTTYISTNIKCRATHTSIDILATITFVIIAKKKNTGVYLLCQQHAGNEGDRVLLGIQVCLYTRSVHI